jgi:ATP-dependent Clp protease adaptor protein ClpS
MKEKEDILVEDSTETTESNQIIIYNDDVNSFDHVIACFQEILKHSYEQASQCALIIHNNGKCSVKEGIYKDLEPLCWALLDRKLSAVIE